MGWGVLNATMLVGLVGAALPVIVHLLSRRRDTVIDWGAMQFLELGKRARRRIRLSELLLMLARMGLLALAALAMARPFFAPGSAPAVAGMTTAAEAPRRDVVLVVDGSASMERRLGGSTPRARAIEWARRFVRRARAGDSIAVLFAGQPLRRVVDPPSFDPARADGALASLPGTHGMSSSDLPAALVDAFRILERTQNPERLVIVLTDGQRYAWRPGESGRWALVRELHRRMPVAPSIWSVATPADESPAPPEASVGPTTISRAVVTPGLPITVTAAVENAGPGPTTRSAELLIDGRPAPVSAQSVGPIAAGGRSPVSFRVAIATPGSHLLTVRLDGLDRLDLDDESSIPVEVIPALPVLLVDGEPGSEPFRGATDFLRAALAPSGDETPQVRAEVVSPGRLTATAMRGRRVVVLAGVEQLSPGQAAAVGAFVDAGGGLLMIPGSRVDSRSWSALGWMPARLGDRRGDPADRKPIAHPVPRTFSGSVLAPFAQGEAPALASADLFAYRHLMPAPGAAVLARLDTGDPWMVQRASGRGQVAMSAAPFDADHGTLPVNPDFVPMAHELIHRLAGGASTPVFTPGEPLIFPLDPPPRPGVDRLAVATPGGSRAEAVVIRDGDLAHARLDGAGEAGIYRLDRPDPPGGAVYVCVAGDAEELDMTPLDPTEAANLARGWPLEFTGGPERLESHLAAPAAGGRHEIWRGLVLGALLMLCVEVFLTRRIVRDRAVAG
jgi:hypothetical protein